MSIDKIKLFCFPYAGGSTSLFTKWHSYLHPIIELHPVELAGRGKRIDEPLYHDLPAAVDDLYAKLIPELHDAPYMLFGHSMGAMLAYELAQKICASRLPPPVHVFFSGRNAPHLPKEKKKFHLMSDEVFKEEVLNLGGTSPELFDHPELLDFFLPLLKNDFKIAESDLDAGRMKPFDFNISVLLGKEEELEPAQCDGWKKHTAKLCTLHYLNGGHFFIHDQTYLVAKLINKIVMDLLQDPLSYAHLGTHYSDGHINGDVRNSSSIKA